MPPHVKELIIRMKEKKKTSAFPGHLKNFARTLRFYSPAAYEMVRGSFLKCLPHGKTMNKWDLSTDYEPGICGKLVDKVSEMVSLAMKDIHNETVEVKKKKKKKTRTPIFNITFEEMGIKQWVGYCEKTHETKGLVDLGGQLEEVDNNDQRKPATKALVFMLVNINGGFKTPVAYYLTHFLTGDKKAVLLKDLLIVLEKNKIRVASVTFDGDESNLKACKVLGANFDFDDKANFKPYFDHPTTSKNVYAFFDLCHMLKLVRNYFASKGPIIHDQTNIIDWKFIRNLNNKQYAEGMHAACKIKNRHVYFYNEKMKVFLAAQVLSRSASKALTLLETEYRDPIFKGAAATARFCEMFNDMFDHLNSRNRFCKSPNRKGVAEKDLHSLKVKIDSYIDYIQKLAIVVNKKVPVKNVNVITDDAALKIEVDAITELIGQLENVVIDKMSNNNSNTKTETADVRKSIDKCIKYLEECQINTEIEVQESDNAGNEAADKAQNNVQSEIKSNYKKKPVGKKKYETISEQISVLKCRSVRTGFLGFIISLTNLYALSKMLIEEGVIEYVLSYKLSQDHVEMFFAIIRRMNGFSNNPTTIQFKSAYKKIMLNNINVTIPSSANCTPQDNTLLIGNLTDSSSPKNPATENIVQKQEVKETEKEKRKVKTQNKHKKIEFDVHNFLHKYSSIDSSNWLTTDYLEDIIKHTAGFVVHSLKKQIHCEYCLSMLNGKVSSKSRLTILKNTGGLKFASDDVVLI